VLRRDFYYICSQLLLALLEMVSSSMVSIIVLQGQAECRYRRGEVVTDTFGYVTAVLTLRRKKGGLLIVSNRYFALAGKVQTALVLVRSRPSVR